MIGIGIMSGSSLDGLDIVAVEFTDGSPISWTVKAYTTTPVEYRIAKSLSRILSLSTQEVFELQSDYTLYMAKAISDFIKDNKLSPQYVGVHGHTVRHSPELKSSWQLLNGGLLSATISLPVVCDFRNQDMAMNGQGTPMAVLADRDLYPGYDYYINLGGIANISYVKDERWVAYDLFPFNQVFNHFAQRSGYTYDKDGKTASTGRINEELLHQLHSESYISQFPPKSIDNSWVRDYWIKKLTEYQLSDADVMRTYVEFAAEHIASLIKSNSKILWTGGGGHHTFFMKRIKSKGIYNQLPDKIVIDSKEAVLIAYASYLRWHERQNFISSATGADRDVMGGAIYLS